MTRAFFFNLIALTIFLVGVVLFFQYKEPVKLATDTQVEQQVSAADAAVSTSSVRNVVVASSSISTAPVTRTAITPVVPKKAIDKAKITTSSTASSQVARVQDPYPTSPESFDQVNADTRKALVNILCEPQGASSLNPISGSGILIDPKGIILTNAHVAQYVLLSESPQVDLKCYVRTGSPAKPTWYASVLYIPPVWVAQHVSDITNPRPTGTGEHDYALLDVTGSVDGTPLPLEFPYLPVDTRPAIGFPGDQILVASYPAELIGGIAAQYNLYADSTITTIKQLMTFGQGTPDVVSLGGIIEAQEGSSGGAVVNQWGRLIALIATTSSGTTTADRDLRGIALNYIDADLDKQLGIGLTSLLSKDPAVQLQTFSSMTAPGLLQLYIQQLSAAH